MDPPLDPELELRTHVRGLLLQYALTHLATNYVTWTQEAVTDLLSESLVFAPMRAPIEVALPIDPFQQLIQSWNLSKLDLYEERWMVGGAEVLSYLKHQLTVPPGAGVSETLWRSDSDEDFDTFLLSRPMSPMLTCRSMRETPLFGRNTLIAKLPQHNGEMLETWRIYPTEEVAFDEVDVTVDDALENKLEIDADSHQAVLTLIKSVPSMSARTGAISATNFEEFLRMDTPPLEIVGPQELPIFPRNQRPGRVLAIASPDPGKAQFVSSLEAMTKAPCSWLSTVAVKDEEDEDIADEHLKLVGGWDGIKTPSSPLTLGTPSLVDSSSDADELFLPSSSNEGLYEEFPLMEVFQLPKAERFGGRSSKPPRLGEGQSLASFITPLIRPSQVTGPPSIRSPKSPTPSPRTHISMSILGQPPSETMGTPDVDQIHLSAPGDGILSSDDSFTFATKVIERACGSFLKDGDLYGLILGEKIDEKDEHLMGVPTLAPPNEHGPSGLPTQLSDLVASTALTASNESIPSARLGRCTGFLKKAKGLQSLQLELSWIPFKYGRTVPTDEEVADVVDDIPAQLVKAIDLPQDDVTCRLSELLNSSLELSEPSSITVTPSVLVWSLDDELDLSVYASRDDDIGLVFTRNDRLRLSGRSPLVDWNPEDTNSSDDEDANDKVASPPERPTKRVRFQDLDDLEDAARIVFEEVIDEAAYTVDGSGVFFASSHPDVDVGGTAYASSFLKMAYDAEGFDGPAIDGNLFFDMDPIHCDHDDPGLASDHLADLSGTSSFRITAHSHNHAFTPTCVEQSHTTHIEPMAADEHPLYDLRTSSSAPLGFVPLVSIVPAAISYASPEPYSESEAMVKEDDRPAPSASSAATAILAVSARQSLAAYLTLCGKAPVLRPDTQPPSFSATHGTGGSGITISDVPASRSSRPRCTPLELFDDRTLVLPSHRSRPTTEHAYMASLSLVQKRALVRELASCCAVNLVEREHLGYSSASPGVMSDSEDLILNCDTAVLFASLELLPARSAGLLALLTRLSWRYGYLLVVFACYPSAWDYSGDAARTGADLPVASVWSPPVVKAVRNLKRDLGIAEGLQTKRETCIVTYAFATSPEEAAAFARMYGDLAEARDASGGDVWGDRLWLAHEERDGECDLSEVDGMNLFASCLLLSQVSLEDFLEKSPEDRLLEYGTLVGVDRIARFNDEMVRRLEAMQLPPSSPIDTASSLHSVPVLDDSEIDSLH